MEKELRSLESEIYISPNIAVIDIETEQCILQGGSGDIPSIPGQDW